VAQQERRLSKRKVLERLTYIDMPGGNGGIVTDVSEGGLGFHVVSPLGKIGSVHFLLSGKLNRIAGTGNVVWTDENKKSGGLSFTEFPVELREQIRDWPLETNLRLEPFAADGTMDAEFGLTNPPEFEPGELDETYYKSYYSEYFPEGVQQPAPPVKRRGVLKAIGISGLAGMAGALSYLWYREARKGPVSSKTPDLREQSEAIAPGADSNESSEIAMLQNTAERSDVGSATLPRISRGQDATAETVVPNEEPPPNAVIHEAETAEPAILFVQVAAVTQKADAYRVLNELQQKSFAAFISPPVNDGFYRVQLGPYQTSEAAHASLESLQEAGYKPFIRR
jgi:hypothetical protein